MTGAGPRQGSDRLKICVIIPRFTISGVPLAQLRFARSLAAAGHDVDLLIGWADPRLTVPANEAVRLRVLGIGKVRNMLVPLVRYLRRERPDVVFSAEDHLTAILLIAAIVARSKAKISGSSRVTPFDTFSNRPLTKRWVLKQLMKSLFWRADALTCVSKDMVGQYRQLFRDPPHVAVYNIVDDPASRGRIAAPVSEPWLADKPLPVIISAGMLQPWKGFDILIDAVAELKRRGREVRLLILGEGPLRPELERQVERLGLADRIKLPGHADNPLAHFARADVFALSSRVEGMPNVLVEAMMCGCTPVAADCPTGPRELLDGGRYGYLVPVDDPAAMADGIEQALDRPIPAERLSEAVAPFEEKTVLGHHFRLLGLGPDA